MKAFNYLLSIAGAFLLHCQSPAPTVEPVPIGPDANAPPAVILMIGDGMGLSQISSAVYSSRSPTAFARFPVVGFHKSYSASDLITDSAAGATAFSCGVKTYNNAIGVGPDTLPCKTILEQAEARGMATGLVSTSTIVHATPAAFIAHEPLRVFYEGIAADFLKTEVDIFIGGGKRYFDRREEDNRNLITELEKKGYIVLDYFYHNLHRARPDPSQNFAFFTADDQPLSVADGRNYLAHASRLATEFLNVRGRDKGFFLMIEGSQIDWFAHSNVGKMVIQETLDFERAIGQVLDFAERRGNTLVIVTADHETGGMALNPASKSDKFEPAFTTNGHTASLVPVFAYGPGAEALGGIYENTVIYDRMRSFLGLDKVNGMGISGGR